MPNQRDDNKKKVTAWVTEEEKEQLKIISKEFGFKNMTEYLRWVAANGPFNPEKDSPGGKKQETIQDPPIPNEQLDFFKEDDDTPTPLNRDISKQGIKDWLASVKKDRRWLADQCGVAPRTVHNWLSTNRPVPSKALRVIQTLMDASEAVRKAAEPLPDMHVVLEVDPKEFDLWNKVSMAQGQTVRDWILDVMESEAERELHEHIQAPAQPPPAEVIRFPAKCLGSIAAGAPAESEARSIEWIREHIPDDHYLLRVTGESMEPEIPDGSLIEVMNHQGLGWPAKGSIVVYADATGASLKKFTTRRDEDGNRVGELKSINPAYPGVEPIEDGQVQGVFVRIVDEN